jgi:hypothetical protein
MSTSRGQLRARRGRRRRTLARPTGAVGVALALAPGLTLAVALPACADTPSADEVALKKACAQVRNVLTNGPDPQATPTGYPEAQIMPLRHIHAPNRPLRAALMRLDAAYQQLFASDGSSGSASRAIVVTSRQISTICHGAAT